MEKEEFGKLGKRPPLQSIEGQEIDSYLEGFQAEIIDTLEKNLLSEIKHILVNPLVQTEEEKATLIKRQAENLNPLNPKELYYFAFEILRTLGKSKMAKTLESISRTNFSWQNSSASQWTEQNFSLMRIKIVEKKINESILC